MKRILTVISIIFFSITSFAQVTLEEIAERFLASKNIRVSGIEVNNSENPINILLDEGRSGRNISEIFFNLNGSRRNCFMNSTEKRLSDGRLEVEVQIHDCASWSMGNDDGTDLKGKIYFDADE